LVLLSSNTWGWYDSQDLTTITKDGSNKVSGWDDKSGNGNDLTQAAANQQPTWSTDGITGDGIEDNLKSAVTTLEQPEFIYALVKQITWTAGDCIMDGSSRNTLRLNQNTITPNIRARVGSTTSVQNSNFPINTWSILRVLIDGEDSFIQVDETDALSIDVDSDDMNGLTILAWGGGGGGWSNVVFKEFFVRSTQDSEHNQTILYNYLKSKM